MVRKRATHGTTQSTASKRTTAQYADQRIMTDAGGEVHQTADGDMPVLLMQQGIPVSDAPNWFRIGARDPTALENFRCREKSCYFDHERIPVRVVYARGFGAPGYLEHYESLASIMKADFFQRARSPHFPHILISVSSCFVHHFQQDRPITMGNPPGW
jgi:catalase